MAAADYQPMLSCYAMGPYQFRPICKTFLMDLCFKCMFFVILDFELNILKMITNENEKKNGSGVN